MKLPRHMLPQEILVEDANDHKLFLDVLVNHPRAAHKCGCGVKEFFVRRSIHHKTLRHGLPRQEEVCCLYVRRLDLSEEDFSIFVPYKQRSWKYNGNSFDAKTESFVLDSKFGKE